MIRFNENIWSQDELNGKWQTLLEEELAANHPSGNINTIVHNDGTTQKMEVLTHQLAAYGNDLASLPKVDTYYRTRVDKEDEWGLWGKQ